MKSNLVLVLAVVAGLSLLPGCGESAKAPEKKTGLVVINVLDKDTYEDCHIAGSINVPFESIDSFIDTIAKDAEVVFYCSNPMCTASEYAALKFQKAGFAHVSVYEGGTAEWYQKGLPVEGAGTSAYLRQAVNHVVGDTHACNLLSVDELALKMGIELPAAVTQIDEVAIECSDAHCMNEQVATLEIPAQK